MPEVWGVQWEEAMNKHIEINKEKIQQNRERIEGNRTEIEKVRDEARYFYESSQTRLEMIIHKLIVALIVVVVLLFVSNAIWIYAWNSSDRSMTITNENVVGSEVGHGTDK